MKSNICFFIKLIVGSFLFSSFAYSSDDGRTLFTFERTNYKPSKILFYDLITNDACQFTGDFFDPHYFETTSAQRIELNSDSYFIPKDVKIISENHIRFTFKALENVLQENPYVDSFVYKDPSSRTCKSLALISVDNQSLNVNKIAAKMRVILGRPLGVKQAKAVVNLVYSRNDSELSFDLSEKLMTVCLYGKDCDGKARLN